MKSLKTIAASLLAVSIVGAASAATYTIKVTGSTAFRAADYLGIGAALGGSGNFKVATTTTSGNMTGASQAVFEGTVGTDTIIVQAAFQGSLAGVHAVVSGLTTIPGASFNSTQTWISASQITGSTPFATLSGTSITNYTSVALDANNNAAPSVCDAAAVPTATFSDSFQSSTPYTSVTLLDEASLSGNVGIGVVEFFWVKGIDTQGVAGNLKNMTSQQANLLASAGQLPLSYFTGVTADASTDVLLVGRNNDSGTRLDEQAEADTSAGAYGFGANGENQFAPVISGGKITGLTNPGDNGYSSGKSVATALDTPQASGLTDSSIGGSAPFIFVGYLGQSDNATATGAGATDLTFNGVTESTAAVTNGTYSFWAYEHLYYHPSLSGTPATFLNSVGNQIRSTYYTASGISIVAMNAGRSVEGGQIVPTN